MAEAFRRVALPRRRRLRLLQTRGRGQGPRLRSPASRTVTILFRARSFLRRNVFLRCLYDTQGYDISCLCGRRFGEWGLSLPILFSANVRVILSLSLLPSVAVQTRAFPSAALVLHFPYAKRLSTENRALRVFLH